MNSLFAARAFEPFDRDVDIFRIELNEGGEIVKAALAERVNAGIAQHIRTIATMATELNIIDMRRIAVLKDED